MESNQDLAALALQIKALPTSVEKLTKQNQEMRLRLQQEDNRSGTNWDNEGDSQRRSDRQQVATPDGLSSDLLWEMRKEMDELRSAIKGKRTETWI